LAEDSEKRKKKTLVLFLVEPGCERSNSSKESCSQGLVTK